MIRFGHSPDPDDAFMFYAIAKNKINMRGFEIRHVIEDIESLNQRALNGELEVTAVSCHAYAYVSDKYQVMRSGASVGNKYGPILVSKDSSDKVTPQAIRGKKIAIPGKLTTAYLALQLFEKNFEAVFIPFDRIFDAVKEGRADYGLIIHEGQLTYQQHGFHNALDLGVWWHEKTGCPLPLGVDVIRRDLGETAIRTFSEVFKESIQYALDHRSDALDYALEYGRGLSKPLGDRFVGMYVNEDTVELSRQSEQGLKILLEEGARKGILPVSPRVDFV
jgi:1,4-dihydroxy-6-naphthoate synthase